MMTDTDRRKRPPTVTERQVAALLGRSPEPDEPVDPDTPVIRQRESVTGDGDRNGDRHRRKPLTPTQAQVAQVIDSRMGY